jgi:CDGSH-type Zn-finger protein
MAQDKRRMKIKVTKNGPYIVTGGVPLKEKIIVPKGKHYVFEEGRTLPQRETYALCRCGKTKTPPFCDGTHGKIGFEGKETASKAPYDERAELIKGSGLNLLDDYRCALARFCHRDKGTAWELIENSEEEENKQEAIRAAVECPAGRITAVYKNGEKIEPGHEPEVVILQDPEMDVSSGIFVKGYIPIESEDGTLYETRNRVMLCRCGHSKNKPFCDASHIDEEYSDEDT